MKNHLKAGAARTTTSFISITRRSPPAVMNLIRPGILTGLILKELVIAPAAYPAALLKALEPGT